MTYPQVLNYLNSFTNYEKNTNYSYKEALKLERIKDFLSIIGDPQKSLRVIHVAGTKGKGSTCAFVAYILRAAGFCVGLYTSPHLNDFRERIRILAPVGVSLRARRAKQSRFGLLRRFAPRNDTVDSARDFEGMISQNELSALVKELKPVINKYQRQSKYGGLSFFEVYTSLAFLYFKRQNLDFVVLETGMGGALDATNVALSLACGITPVSFEHVQKLGKTLKKIAGEKAGIIKNKCQIVISAVQDREAEKVIHNRCKKFQAKLFEVGKQIRYFMPRNKGDGSIVSVRGQRLFYKNSRCPHFQQNRPLALRRFTIKGFRGVYKNLRLQLLGEHQIANAALAVGLVEALSYYGFSIGSQAIRMGLYNTIWPGRCEVVQKNPWVVLDGAQNSASAATLKSAIKNNFKYKQLILVLGISLDKDISGISKTLAPLADQIILTRAATPRALEPLKLSAYFKRKVYLTQSVKEAKLLAESLAAKEDLILVAGSLFVVGEFRNV